MWFVVVLAAVCVVAIALRVRYLGRRGAGDPAGQPQRARPSDGDGHLGAGNWGNGGFGG